MGQKAFRDRVTERAISKTWKTARAHVWQSVSILAVVTIFTLLGTVAAKGSSAAWGEAQTYFVVIGANAAAILLIFGWNLWLAPYELVMEEIGGLRAAIPIVPLGSIPPGPPPPPMINWVIWKQRSDYTFKELSNILAKTVPTGPLNTEGDAYHNLIVDEVKHQRLKVHHRWPNPNYEETPELYPENFLTSKENAIAWATAKGFDVAHIS